MQCSGFWWKGGGEPELEIKVHGPGQTSYKAHLHLNVVGEEIVPRSWDCPWKPRTIDRIHTTCDQVEGRPRCPRLFLDLIDKCKLHLRPDRPHTNEWRSGSFFPAKETTKVNWTNFVKIYEAHI